MGKTKIDWSERQQVLLPIHLDIVPHAVRVECADCDKSILDRCSCSFLGDRLGVGLLGLVVSTMTDSAS